MKILLTLIALSLLCLQTSFVIAKDITSFPIIHGCEGEGCGQTRDTKSDKKFVVYQNMQTSSKILGKFPKGTKAENLGAHTLIFDRGKSVITKVIDQNLGLKIGDEIDTIFSEGEGFMNANFKGKTIQFFYDSFELERITPPHYETWYEVKVGNVKGYSPEFPFLGVLE